MTFLKRGFTGIMLICLLQACSRSTYTSNTYFDCVHHSTSTALNDTTAFLNILLTRAAVTEKDVPDYHLLRDKKRIYVLNQFMNSRFPYGDTSGGYKPLPAIVNQIGNTVFCLKSAEELKRIANAKGAFLYLQLGNITIDKETATASIQTTWAAPDHSRIIFLSGGGYLAHFKKINNHWAFSEYSITWIS